MRRFRFVSFCIALALITAPLLAASNPLPLVYQPLIPASVRPGSAAFTLTVNGAHFVSGAIVQWNGLPLPTTFISRSRLRAKVPAANVAKVGTASITVANPASGAKRSNVVYLPVRLPSGTVSFKLDASVTTPGGLAVADLNHDGNPDVIVATDSSSLRIDSFLGKGNGLFTSIVAAKTQFFPPIGALVADMNGDGKPDILATLDGGFPVTFGQVFLGNGNGTLRSAGGGGSVQGTPVGVGDFHGNGKLDLTVLGNSVPPFGGGGYGFLSGNGDGTLGAFEPLAQNPLAASGTQAPAIADFNGDGKLDLAFAGVSVYLGNGDGTFQSALNSFSSHSAGTVVAADLNGDGKLDLVSGGTCVSLGHGNGTFTEGSCITLPAGLTVIFFDLADMNGDGKLDLVVLAADENNGNFPQKLFIALGNGNGTFKPPVAFSAGLFNILLTSGLAIADFNHDGKLDVAVGSLNRTFIYLQQ